MRDYKMQEMSGERALEILADVLTSLGAMEEGELTTLELQILHRCAENPPSRRVGVEWPKE